jgi:hypothetical protein
VPIPAEFWALSEELHAEIGDGPFICEQHDKHVPCRQCMREETAAVSDWKTTLAEHPVVQAMGYDARDIAVNDDLCPPFQEQPSFYTPWTEDEADCE